MSTRKPTAKLMALLSAASVPRGMEVGKIASQGPWIVVEDVRNHRLLRFKAVQTGR